MLLISDVNKTTVLKTKTTIGKTKTKVGESNTKNKTNVIAADKVIINCKVAIIVSFYGTIFCMFSLFFIITFFGLYACKVNTKLVHVTVT